MRPRCLHLHGLWLAPLLAVQGLGAAGDNRSLVQAAEQRDRAAVKVLLTQHADVNVSAADGTTALHWAAHWNDSDMATLLLQAGAKVDAVNRYRATPLWAASKLGNVAVVQTLLKAGADPNAQALEGETALIAAARTGSGETVKALLAHGADVNAKESRRGQTALMMTVGSHEPSADVARVLVEHGADVHIASKGGLTALLFAVRQNDIESARLLLAASANVNDNAPGGMSALRIAINNKHFDIAELLVEKGADVKATDKSGFTPLHVVIQERAGGDPERGDKRNGTHGEETIRLMRSLLARGADPNARLPIKRIPPDFNSIGYPEINNVQYGGATPFWIAALTADLDAMRVLVDAGADPRVLTMEKTTPLMVAAGLGYANRGPSARLGGRRVDLEEPVLAAVKQLLEWGNDVNAVNDNGQTALHGAVGTAMIRVVQFLIDQGARLDQKDAIGRTPFAIADEHRTDKYRTNQALEPAGITATYELLRKVSTN